MNKFTSLCLAAMAFVANQAMAASITFDINDYVAKSSNEFSMSNGIIGNTINNSYLVYKFTATETEKLQAFVSASTNNASISACVMLGTDLDALIATPVTGIYTHDIAKAGWANYNDYLFGPFDVVAGTEYYYKITFIRPGGGSKAYACNAKNLGVETYQGGDISGVPDAETIQHLTAGNMNLNLGQTYALSGSISASESVIDNTKNGAYAIFDFTVPSSGNYDVTVNIATPKDGSALNVMISDDAEAVKTAELDDNKTVDAPNTGDWTTDSALNFSSYSLEANKVYYLRLSFLQSNATWVGNVHSISLMQTSGISGIEADHTGEAVYYNLNGLKVDLDKADHGVYIKLQGGNATKVVL